MFESSSVKQKVNILIDLKKIRSKIITKNNLYCLCVISIIFFLDRYTKLLILNHFNENSYYLNNFLNLDLIWNTGIGFGIFSSTNNLIYHLITFIISIVILFLFYLIAISKIKREKIFFSLIIGGALGNFYDRIVFRAVPDFIDIHYKNFHWFTFNVADIFISVGIITLMLIGVREKKEI